MPAGQMRLFTESPPEGKRTRGFVSPSDADNFDVRFTWPGPIGDGVKKHGLGFEL
jgi:hypothetical protein